MFIYVHWRTTPDPGARTSPSGVKHGDSPYLHASSLDTYSQPFLSPVPKTLLPRPPVGTLPVPLVLEPCSAQARGGGLTQHPQQKPCTHCQLPALPGQRRGCLCPSAVGCSQSSSRLQFPIYRQDLAPGYRSCCFWQPTSGFAARQ